MNNIYCVMHQTKLDRARSMQPVSVMKDYDTLPLIQSLPVTFEQITST